MHLYLYIVQGTMHACTTIVAATGSCNRFLARVAVFGIIEGLFSTGMRLRTIEIQVYLQSYHEYLYPVGVKRNAFVECDGCGLRVAGLAAGTRSHGRVPRTHALCYTSAVVMYEVTYSCVTW